MRHRPAPRHAARALRRSVLRTAPVTVFALGAAVLAPAAVAHAGTTAAAAATASFSTDGRTFTFTAAAGQDDRVTVIRGVSDGNAVYDLTDTYAITAGNGCTYPDAAVTTHVVCTAVDTVPKTESYLPAAVYNLGDGSDHFTLTDHAGGVLYWNTQVNGGTGNDSISLAMASDSIDYIYGNSGNDAVTVSGPGSVHVSGGAGNDTVNAAETTGFNVLAGGGGNDTVKGGSYGGVIEGDQGNDTLHGSSGNDTLFGDQGNDTVYGAGGDDVVWGNSGNDKLYGGTGNDQVLGGPGDDTLYGNSGNDTLRGGPGTDRISGGTGRNTITS
jgi:serralysin